MQFSPNLHKQSIFSRGEETCGQDIYANKLELKIKDLKAQIKKNKPLIEQIKAQRKFLKKICEKQR